MKNPDRDPVRVLQMSLWFKCLTIRFIPAGQNRCQENGGRKGNHGMVSRAFETLPERDGDTGSDRDATNGMGP